ncbi:MAG: hypothetical protein KKF62_09950 [Bacteroidetes bacterium]|nr:hypothetical protein [Bacteroidota bacterium]MBU1116591.1 hypothetical protein [Bacteroidota bacterium]MBU1797187.1 hypothetical protein [Bacteroidota bacterium]
MEKRFHKIKLIVFALMSISCVISAQSKFALNTSADIVSRYVWRGIDFGRSPAIQPTLSLGYGGLEAGFWGSYTLNSITSASDELDFWLAYSVDISALSITALVNDYYFPNNGKALGNFNNYDDVEGNGAHTLEAGLVLSSDSFPLSLSSYYNFYNDAGNNMYFQLDCPFEVNDYEVDLFVGATTGSKENPDYYGTEEFNIINVGLQVSKEIKITEDFSLPIFTSYIINPTLEQHYLVFGVSF